MDGAALERRAFARFLGGAGTWFLAFGMQHLVFQWLVVSVLRETPARVGAAQMTVLLPSLLLLLPGGAAADRADRTRLLIALHWASAALFAGLGALVLADRLSYGTLLAFSAVLGVCQAFQVPAREGQLHEVAHAAMERGVVASNLIQQAGQALGALAAGLAATALGGSVLLLQALLLTAGALCQAGLRAGSAAHAATRREERAASGLRVAVAAVARDPVRRTGFLLTAAVGLLFVGPYGVVLPILVRDSYGGGAREMGMLSAMLPLGGILAGAVLLARGGIRRPGRALLLGQAFSALCLAAIGASPPFAGAVLLVLGWGVGSAFFLNAGRTLFHLRTRDADRATVLSVYAFGILGTGPLGSLLSGLLVSLVGPHATLVLQGALMGLGVALASANAPLRRA